MSVTISRDSLFDIVQKAYSVAPTKSSLQILANLMISCSGEQIEIIATDLDQSIRCRGKVSGTGTFQVAINARKLFDIVKEMPAGDVTIEEDEHVLAMSSEKGFSCKVAGSDVADFPAFPAIGDTIDFAVSPQTYKQLVSKSCFAVSRDATRSCLCGVYWEVEPDSFSMIGTDGHRLGKSTNRYTTGVSSSRTAIVSPKSMQHVARVIESAASETPLRISLGEKYVVISGEDFMLCSKLIEGPYPDYSKVIPKQNPKAATIDRASLINAVRRVSVLSSAKTHLVKMQFESDTVEIMVLNRDIGGEAREIVQVSYDGEKHNIGFNAVYLTEILSIVDTPSVMLQMNTQISACLVFPFDSEKREVAANDLFLIMPLRLMDEV